MASYYNTDRLIKVANQLEKLLYPNQFIFDATKSLDGNMSLDRAFNTLKINRDQCIVGLSSDRIDVRLFMYWIGDLEQEYLNFNDPIITILSEAPDNFTNYLIDMKHFKNNPHRGIYIKYLTCITSTLARAIETYGKVIC